MERFPLFALVVLSACAPSAHAIQTAIVQTQQAAETAAAQTQAARPAAADVEVNVLLLPECMMLSTGEKLSERSGGFLLPYSTLRQFGWGLVRKGIGYESPYWGRGDWLYARVDQVDALCPGFSGSTVVAVTKYDNHGNYISVYPMTCSELMSYSGVQQAMSDAMQSNLGINQSDGAPMLWKTPARAACKMF